MIDLNGPILQIEVTRVALLPKYGGDPDLEGLNPAWPVRLGEISTDGDFNPRYPHIVENYMRIIGESGLRPPVVATITPGSINDDPYLVTGSHRLTAAARLGLTTYPCYFVTPS